VDRAHIDELKSGNDRTNDADLEGLEVAMNLAGESQKMCLTFSSNPEELKFCNAFVVTVPTPIDHFKVPDLSPLLKASQMLGEVLKKGDLL